MLPLTSVVIPCYNSEKFIEESIHSALNQTYSNIEVIVVNDGSTDNSQKKIETFGKRIIYKEIPNGGACKARNIGISLSQGAFIKFLDADDALVETCIENQIQETLKANSKNLFIYSDTLFCDENLQNCNRKTTAEFTSSAIVADRILSCFGLGLVNSSPLYIKDELQKIGGFNQTLTNAQEIDLNVRLILNGNRFVKCENSVAAKIRTHNSPDKIGVSKFKNPFGVYDSLNTILNEIVKKDININNGIDRSFAFSFWNTGRNMIRKGFRTEANVYFKKATEVYPPLEAEQPKRYYRLLLFLFGPLKTELILKDLIKIRKRISFFSLLNGNRRK